MSLYHEAAEVLAGAKKSDGSLKSVVFSKKTWKSDPKALFALATETAKWSEVLSEVVEKSGILKTEKALTPSLAVLLVHDLFLARKGIALPATHGLNSSVSRHKVRLSAELTKARLRRGHGSLESLRKHIDTQTASGQQSAADGMKPFRHPRWVRINTLKSTLEEELKHATFANYTQAQKLEEILHAPTDGRLIYVDEHIPDLVAIASPDDPTSFKAYKSGKLIFQEKASCFPAYLLDLAADEGDTIDACAAPGNKTTHLASLLSDGRRKVIACERDPDRSKILEKMVKLAGADHVVTVRPRQDFTRLDPTASQFSKVTSLLLDPSCSGSGIFGRDEGTITIHLPSTTTEEPGSKSRKRKRDRAQQHQLGQPEPETAIVEETPEEQETDVEKLKTRLDNLSRFQLRILEHAMTFPAAKRITYSTCSVHAEENEHVVVKALLSDVAVERGWRVLRKHDQIDGMKRWHKRGSYEATSECLSSLEGKVDLKAIVDAAHVAEACIRCDKGGEDGTMGFFVAGFVRNAEHDAIARSNGVTAHEKDSGESEDEWDGFSDDET